MILKKFLASIAMFLALIGSGCMATQPAYSQFINNMCTQGEVTKELGSINGELYYTIDKNSVNVFQDWIVQKVGSVENTFDWSRVDFYKNTEHGDYPILVLIYTQDIRVGVDCTYFMGFLSKAEADEVIELVRGV